MVVTGLQPIGKKHFFIGGHRPHICTQFFVMLNVWKITVALPMFCKPSLWSPQLKCFTQMSGLLSQVRFAQDIPGSSFILILTNRWLEYNFTIILFSSSFGNNEFELYWHITWLPFTAQFLHAHTDFWNIIAIVNIILETIFHVYLPCFAAYCRISYGFESSLSSQPSQFQCQNV